MKLYTNQLEKLQQHDVMQWKSATLGVSYETKDAAQDSTACQQQASVYQPQYRLGGSQSHRLEVKNKRRNVLIT